MTALPRLRPLEILHVPDEDEGTRVVLRDPEGFSDEELLLSEAALFVAAHFDGEHSLEEAQAAFARRYGTRPAAEQIRDLERRLDEAFFLDNETFARRRGELVAAFLAAPRRSPAHAGISYPSDPAEAARRVAGFFELARGLEEPGERPPGRLAGMVAPHIDLRVGGPCAALAYSELARAEGVDTVVVLGTAHACPHPAWLVLDKPFSTPLGEVPLDEEACRLLAAVHPADAGSAYYHHREHSIEFQALFLAALGRAGRRLAMIPVLCGSIRGPGEDEAGRPFLTALRKLVEERGERIAVVAGADLAHVGPRFGDAEELSERHRRLLERKDRATLAFVTGGDAGGFYGSVLEAGDPRRICGLAPIHGLLSVLPGTRGKVLRYEQANEPSGTVSYASVALWTAA